MFNLKVLCKEETEKILKMKDVIPAIESAYSQKAAENAKIFDWVFHEFNPGVADMDIKSGWLKNEGIYGLKLVSWFSENRKINLPDIIGVIMVFDDKTGKPIGLVDGAHITGMRTGASGAIGAKYLARKNSETLLMVGTGHISKFEIAATLIAVPTIKKVLIHDPRNHEGALTLASKIKDILKNEFEIEKELEIIAESNLENAVKESDIIITATPSREPMIKKEWVKAGTHFSCIGADMPGKEEIDYNIFEGARVFVDDLKQCMHMGELEIPIKKGVIKPEDVAGEIGDIINDRFAGRLNDEQITIYDATGTALLDLITAQLAFKKAEEQNIGVNVNL
jgi:ornithine cyclodeaminase/alanine dehydrogenase